jgi:ABC-type uncharacterized transport system permease subunit
VLKGNGTDRWVKLLGALAVILHGFTAYKGFINTNGYDLGFYPMLSLMAFSIGAIVLISSLRRPVDNLFLFVFPLAVSTIILQIVLKGDFMPRQDVTGGIFSHIALSIIAYSLLTIAAAQALLLSFGDNMLRHHQLIILRNLPPLETMEHLMFEMIWAGLVFLTLSIGSGFIFIADFSEPGLVHHTAITLAAWIVFIVLAWGRYQLGWRGEIASRWTLFGFVLLALGYFGSKLVLEVILGKS